jgi:hypothetical protein
MVGSYLFFRSFSSSAGVDGRQLFVYINLFLLQKGLTVASCLILAQQLRRHRLFFFFSTFIPAAKGRQQLVYVKLLGILTLMYIQQLKISGPTVVNSCQPSSHCL